MDPREKNRLIRFYILQAAIVVFGSALFYSFPNLDMVLMGLRHHRHFLFHSAIFPALFAFLALRISPVYPSRPPLLAAAAAFCLGFGAHLVREIGFARPVLFPGGFNFVPDSLVDDTIWIVVNCVACLALAAAVVVISVRTRDDKG